jgi:hypothetical protein
MATVLEKCDISDKVIGRLIKKGLFVPKKVKPFKNPIKSPSEEWFYQVADRFTPPLTKGERNFYIKNPRAFCEQIVNGARFLTKTCELLYDTSEKAKKLPPKEAIAALLVIQRIFHAVLDHSHLKYDRHLEYHDYESSPVGYHWQRLKKLCLHAAENAKVANPKEFADEKILELISGYGIAIKSAKREKVANDAYDFIIINLKNKQQRKELSELRKILKQFLLAQDKEAQFFYCGFPPRNLDAMEGGFHYWGFLKTFIKKNPNLVRPSYRKRVNKWFQAKEAPEIIMAARGLVQLDAAPFAQEVQDLYSEELKRWRLS